MSSRQWRTHSTLLVSLATKQKHVTYLNASPAPHTWRRWQAQGFRPTISAAAPSSPCPAAARSARPFPGDLPEAQLLRDHRAMGCISLVVEKDGIVSPFVFKPRRLDRPPVPVMDVMFCRGPDDFRRCAPALARHFLPRGRVGLPDDGDSPGICRIMSKARSRAISRARTAPAWAILPIPRK